MMDPKQIKDILFLELRSKMGEILYRHGVIDSNDGVLGWWETVGQNTDWISFYEVMEEARD